MIPNSDETILSQWALPEKSECFVQKLNKMSAQTDVIQSNADVNRNVSSGTKTLLESSSVTIGTPPKETVKSIGWDIVSLVLGGFITIGLFIHFYKKKKVIKNYN